jgi:phytoene synthase
MPVLSRPDKDDLAACRALLRAGSKSFFAASVLLPPRVRETATVLYAFCRLADDAVDLSGAPEDAVATLSARLDGIYARTPIDHPVDRALSIVVQGHALPRVFFDALLDGLAWDAGGRTYRTLSELIDYSARVAGTVGALMTLLMGGRHPDVLARACDLGVAMQLTNIARDVGEDARAGRIYLPLDWLAEAGLDPAALLDAPAFDARLAGIVQRLLDEAARLYRRSEGGIAHLPVGCRPAIHAARLIYAEIGVGLAANGYDSISRRTVVPRARKVALLARAVVDSGFAAPGIGATALAEVQFLVDAVQATPAQGIPAQGTRGHAIGEALSPLDLDAKMARVLDMFEKLARRTPAPRPVREVRRRSVRTSTIRGAGLPA